MLFKKIGLVLYIFFSFTSVSKEIKNKQEIKREFFEKRNIYKFYKNWKGTKYKFGGQTKKGIDCSSLMQNLYKERYSKYLSRTTLTQVNEGIEIKNRKNWKIGDLIFFKNKENRHVGVYIGNNRFMHSGSSTGVTVSEFNNYWKKQYWQTRRIK